MRGDIFISQASLKPGGADGARRHRYVMQDDTLHAVRSPTSAFDPPDRKRTLGVAASPTSTRVSVPPWAAITPWSATWGRIAFGRETRLFLARALYKRPGILVLDKPPGLLDVNNGERAVNRIVSGAALTDRDRPPPRTIRGARQVIVQRATAGSWIMPIGRSSRTRGAVYLTP